MAYISVLINNKNHKSEADIIPTLLYQDKITDIKVHGKKIVQIVARHTNVSPELIMHHSRCRSNIADARQLAMYLVHVSLGISMTAVGQFFSRDRTTVSHACARIEDRRDEAEFDKFINKIEDELESFCYEIEAGEMEGAG